MKAVKMLGNRGLEVVDAPVPEARGDEVLIRVRASGICGSDLHALYQRQEPSRQIPGHEFAGEVVQVDAPRGLKVGNRVTATAACGCGICHLCRSGDTAYCRNKGGIGWSRDGADAEYVLVPEASCLPLPDDVSFEVGSLIQDAMGTTYHGLKKIGVSGMDVLGVFGLGPIGLGAVLVAKQMGATAIGFDLSAYRLELAKQLGADYAFHPDEDPRTAVMEITQGRGLDKAAECAGADATLNWCLDLTRIFGKVALLGEHRRATINPSGQLIHKGITMSGSTCFNLGEYGELLSLIEKGARPERMITHRFPLEEAAEAFRLFESGQTGKVIFVP